MKNIKFILIAAIAFIAIVPTSVHATNRETNTTQTAAMNRLQEIKKMDIALMDRNQKTSLRKEVLTMRENMKSQSPVIYISGGALILIIILLIILL